MTSSARRVFVTGGTGAVGRPAVYALVAAGHVVSALARTPERARLLVDQGVRPVAVSIFDFEALSEALRGHDAVINLATALPSTRQFIFKRAFRQNTRIRTEGSSTIVDAALAVGVSTLIQESVCMLYPDCADHWITEDVPPDRFPMAEPNLAAEANAQRLTAAGGVGVVLRFGWFYGPGATHSEEFFALARHHIGVMMGRPDGYVSSIHVDDAGGAVVAALAAPAGTYNVVDDEPLTKRRYTDAMEAAAGTGMWVRAPGRAALLLGDRTTSLTRSLRVSNCRFKGAVGWTPLYPSAVEGWQATARALAASPRRA